MRDSHQLKSTNFPYVICLILLVCSCQSPEELDEVTLKLSNQNRLYVNLSLGFIMLGVALKLQIKDFIHVFSSPKSVFKDLFPNSLHFLFLLFYWYWFLILCPVSP